MTGCRGLQRIPTVILNAGRCAMLQWTDGQASIINWGRASSGITSCAADSPVLQRASSIAPSVSTKEPSSESIHWIKTGDSSSDAVHRVETRQPQLTLLRPVVKGGIGLHSGEIAELKLQPAAAGEGRYFVFPGFREGEDGRIPAMIKHVRETRLSTCLGMGNVSIRTVEHLLSALEGLGVDNCRIEVTGGNEVPLLDGSALEWVEAIENAGLSVAKDGFGSLLSRKALVLKEPVSVCHGESFVAAFPGSTTRLTYGIDFPQVKDIGRQWFTWSPDDNSPYGMEVAPARTFGIFEQINQLQAAGLIKGGSLKNALVCSMEKGWLNPPLRFPDEPCRHKLLDLIGDLALCAYKGHPGLPVGHVIAYKASHALHVKFGEEILQARLQ